MRNLCRKVRDDHDETTTKEYDDEIEEELEEQSKFKTFSTNLKKIFSFKP